MNSTEYLAFSGAKWAKTNGPIFVYLMPLSFSVKIFLIL